MNSRNVWKLIHERHANAVIASVILLGAAIATALMVAFWLETVSSGQTDNASSQADYTGQKLAERLTFQHVYYNLSDLKVRVFIMNAGTANSMTLENVYIKDMRDISTIGAFSNITLFDLNGNAIPDQNLDRNQQGYFALSSLNLTSQTAYWVKILTGRNNNFGYLSVTS